MTYDERLAAKALNDAAYEQGYAAGLEAGRAEVQSRMFPGLGPGAFAIPWHLIAPHEKQAMRNHGGQSLEVLARRGGLSACEMIAVLEDREWKSMPDISIPRAQIKALVDADPLRQLSAAQAENERLREACKAALAMFDEKHAIDSFNWGASVLTADNIRELNETPGILRKSLKGQPLKQIRTKTKGDK